MNKKVIAIIVAIAVVIIGSYVFIYQPYQENLLSGQFNEGLQNASSVETQIITTTDQFNKQNSTDVDVLIGTINNDITPKYSDELLKLNQTAKLTNNNNTKKKYIDLQMKRVELESQNIKSTVTKLNAISQYVKGEKNAQDAQTSINNADTAMSNSQKELQQVYTDINTLLKQNPSFNQTLQDLKLEKPYYGETRTQTQTQNITNSTET
ncbi:MAG: hypothetical protein IJJ47_12455 [Methanosphaera sp.]|nr:hypothetical protein [Methanosphaera sp.]